LLSKFGSLTIRRTIGVLKGEATKALRAAGFSGDCVWSRECHPKSKREGREFLIALKYVNHHQAEGAAVYIWPKFRELLDDA
jgi:hypothetical protein